MQHGDIAPSLLPLPARRHLHAQISREIGKVGAKGSVATMPGPAPSGVKCILLPLQQVLQGFLWPCEGEIPRGSPELSTLCAPCSPMMMVQALTSPISFLSATRSEVPGPGPGPGEGEGVGPGFPRPPGCCMWPVMSLSRLSPAPCATPSVRPAASLSVGPSVGALAALAARDSAHRRAHALARSPGPRGPPSGWIQRGTEGGPAGSPLPHCP